MSHRFPLFTWCVLSLFILPQGLMSAESSAPGIVEQALGPRSGPRGHTLFVQLAPEQTNVVTENNFSDPEMWGKRYREVELGGIGTGVTIGDYDGDGRPDLFIVSKTESCRLFRNLGGFKFEDVTVKAGVGDQGAAAKTWKQGATFVDVNNDGLLDLYVCRYNAANLLYINQGDGTFKEEAHAYGLDVKDASVMAAFCDYDRDGLLDVFIQTSVLDATAHPEGQRDYLFHNNGNGTFTNVTKQAGVAPAPTHGNSCVWWDYDGDGWPDLYVANDFDAPDALYRNNHDGTFTDIIRQSVPHVPYSAMGSDVGDINNDGRLDLMVADMIPPTHTADQRTMAESRARQMDAREDATAVPQFPRNVVFLNTGTGRSMEVAQLAGLAATDWTWSVRWEDLDNDGRLDLYVTNGMHREIHNVDLIARRASAESEAERIRVMKASPVFALRHLAFRNRGDLQFEDASADWGLDQKAVSFGAAFGDLDGDGDLDLVYSNYQSGATVLRNDSDTGHRVVIALRGTRSNRFGIGAKLRLESAAGLQVRELTLARGYMSTSEPIVHFGLGEDSQINRLVIFWPSGAEQTFENLPADRRYVITEPTPAPASPALAHLEKTATQFTEIGGAANLAWRAREELFDELLTQPLLPWRMNRRGPAVAVANFDGSGYDSVALGGTTLDPLRVLRSGTEGKFAAIESAVFATQPGVDDGPMLGFDATGHGKVDLLITHGGASQPADSPEYQPQLLLNDGAGHFQPAPEGALPPLPISVGAVATADFNHDGKLDLFIGGRLTPGEYPLTPRSALLINRGGKFEDATSQLAPSLANIGMVTSALWSDLDGDGWLDLILTLEWGGVKYFHNRHGEGLDDWSEEAGFASAGTGWWRSIASGDFNGDGLPDYVVGNLGLNTPYRADAQHPALLYVGDFGGRGAMDLIEAYYEGDTLYPRRSRRELATAIPSLLRRFPKNDVYARASLSDILTQSKVDSATRLAVTELQSGVFLSERGGRYHFVPLPRLAQAAPINGIAVADFDGDGHPDLIVVQNSPAPTPSSGRFDGGLGLLLRGDGHGNFIVAQPANSGLVVPGDAEAIAVLDIDHDGWPDVIVSRNNDVALAFRNGGTAGHHSFRLSLRDGPGNPCAIGARVTAKFADGSAEIFEIGAGSNQSASSPFFGYADHNPIRSLHVVWPSGATTDHKISGNPPPTLILEQRR